MNVVIGTQAITNLIGEVFKKPDRMTHYLTLTISPPDCCHNTHRFDILTY